MTGSELIRYLAAVLGLVMAGFAVFRRVASHRGALPSPPIRGAIPDWLLAILGVGLILAALLVEPGGTQAPLFTR